MLTTSSSLATSTDPLVVVPTYNECENIQSLVGQILALDFSARILVVDDGSPDGTGDIADSLERENPRRVFVLHREVRGGLGPAYRHGFAVALASGARHIYQMDADLSHSPAALNDFQKVLASNEADLVIGSRYVPGGGTLGWPIGRRMVSRFGSLYARTILGLPVRDATGGFKGWSATLLEKVNPATVASRGYLFQIEMTYRAMLLGARIREIPILFRERQEGVSKMTARIAFEAAAKVPLMALHPPKPPFE